jgi:hypothetical protein
LTPPPLASAALVTPVMPPLSACSALFIAPPARGGGLRAPGAPP